MNRQFDVIVVLIGAGVFFGVVYFFTNWRERRREFLKYRDCSTTPGVQPGGDYRHFVRLWRLYRHDYLEATLAQPRRVAISVSLGEYVRLRELEGSRTPLKNPIDEEHPQKR